MRARLTFILTAALAIPAAGCSVVIDSDQYTGGSGCDASVCLPDGGPGGPVQQQEQLFDIRGQRVTNWCDCYAGLWNHASSEACQDAINPPDAYEQCVTSALAAQVDNDPMADRSFLECQIQARQEALTCEQQTACAFGAYNACQTQLVQDEVVSGACAPSEAYFSDLISCASANVVGTASGVCPGDSLTGATIVGDNIGSGNDFDFSSSECFVNSGAADQVIQWQAQGTGDVIIDTIGSTYDTALYLVDNCTDRNVTVCNDDVAFNSGILQSKTRTQVTDGDTLLTVVDAFSAADFGALRVNYTALYCVSTDVDTSAIPSMTGTAVLSGSLSSAQDDDSLAPLTPDCAGGVSLLGADDVVAWEAPADGTYTFDTSGSNFDTVLYMRRSCDEEAVADNTFEVCDDDGAGSTASIIQASLLAGETVILAIESKDTLGGGDWQINIQ